MHKHKWTQILLIIGLIVLALAACGDDDDKNDKDAAPSETPPPTATPADDTETLPGGDLTVPSAPDLGNLGGGDGGDESGCDDEDECPAPIPTTLLDAEESAGGVTVSYVSVIFDATTSDDDTGVLIEITPSEQYKFEQRGTFQVYFAEVETVEAVLAEATDLPGVEIRAEKTWEDDPLGRQFVAVRDMAQDPPYNLALGAGRLDDGRVIVLKLEATGKFGWDLFYELYEGMLESLTVE
jgi:hypothetical protein